MLEFDDGECEQTADHLPVRQTWSVTLVKELLVGTLVINELS